MAAYAPVLSHIKLRTWVPDLIAFEATDSGKLYGTPSYYVQQLFSRFQGGHHLQQLVACKHGTKTVPDIHLQEHIACKRMC